MVPRCLAFTLLGLAALGLAPGSSGAQPLEVVPVEAQPLASNVKRLIQALELLGAPLPAEKSKALKKAADDMDAPQLQKLLDPLVHFAVTINPESRVKLKRGPAEGDFTLQQGGYTALLVKVVNEGTVTQSLRILSPQSLPVYARGEPGKIKPADVKDRFLDVDMFTDQPMTKKLSGLKVEYAIALMHSTQAGKREAIIGFAVDQGTQDLGFRGEIPVLFSIRPAIAVKLHVFDDDGKPTTGRFTFTDKAGKVYPPQARRLAPDFFFQKQVYRHSGGVVLLPPGEMTMNFGRGPEYLIQEQKITVPERGEMEIPVKLRRWIHPTLYGWFSGDHHIHAAGCAHYTNPTEGVFANDMFVHVKGEALNVGCNLTWGPCYDFQRQFFEPTINKVSEPFTVLKYDIEVSGFGSQALGHVCLLNLKDQTYPGSEGTSTKGWPTWTTPLMKWAKAQGAFTGYAHSANGMIFDAKGVEARSLAKRTMAALDSNKDGKLSPEEAEKGLLPDDFGKIDVNGNGFITEDDLLKSINSVWTKLPNYAVPPMNGIGAQEICVTSAQGLCDFISAMDTMRVPEWNCWYHIMNCGFPLKASGETDFPCITGSRVGQGRVYVQMGKIDKIDFPIWSKNLAEGRSYVSDGYAHALQFTVDGKPAGDKVELTKAGKVTVKAKVAFAADLSLGTSVGAPAPSGKTRLVEIIVNGQVAATKEVPADDKSHDLSFEIPLERSSWVALRQYPQLHTNPVNVIIDGAPIRASRRSALWCLGTIEQLWRVRNGVIAPQERMEAERTFQWAIERYRKIAAECPKGS